MQVGHQAFVDQALTLHRIAEAEAAEVAVDLAYNLAKKAYRLDGPAPTATRAACLSTAGAI